MMEEENHGEGGRDRGGCGIGSREEGGEATGGGREEGVGGDGWSICRVRGGRRGLRGKREQLVG